MRLNDPLPWSFEYGGKEYPLDLAFDNVLDVHDVMESRALLDHEKVQVALRLLVDGEVIGDLIGMWNHIYKEYITSQTRTPVQYDIAGNLMPTMDEDEDDDREPHFDFSQDAGLIYASFLDAYDIDLFEQQGKMHWWVFQALLEGLPQKTILQRVIQIRLWKPEKGDSAKYRASMKKAQSHYRLIKDRRETQDG